MNKKSQNKISTDQDSQNDINCSCEILNDTSLSNIGDSECSCSECLEANLNAFNQIKDLQEKDRLKECKSLDKIPSLINQNKKGEKILDDKNKKSTKYDRSNMSLNKKTIKKNFFSGDDTNRNHQNQQYPQISSQQNQFRSQDINEYILITKQRTRQYLNQRKNLQNKNKKQKEELKQKIQENLEILKYTAKVIHEKDLENKMIDNQERQTQNNEKKVKWNHEPLQSKKLRHIRQSRQQSRRNIHHRKEHRQKVSTNLQKLIPQFSQNPSQFLQQVKQQRLQKFKQCKGCPHDSCPGHHMRTSKEDLAKIEKFIKKQVEKYNKKKKKQKKQKQQKQKVKKAKLRAIDIKCKEIVKKSRKYDPSQSRTSFHLSIQHYSTFSDLKHHKKQLEQQRQHNRQVRKMIKQKGGRLQQAIYQDVNEHEQFQLPDNTKIKPNKKQVRLDGYQNEFEGQQSQYCRKITKQAKISTPKKIKQHDAEYLKKKKEQKKPIASNMNPNDQKKKNKQIEMQIQRKKRQLMKQYKKQKQLNQSKNQKLKISHKRMLEGDSVISK